jgi:hypothetical protein
VADAPRSSSAIRTLWVAYRCATSKYVQWRPHGSPWLVYVADDSLPAWQALNVILAKWGYTFDEVAGGTYNCRKIAGTNVWSIHAYALALDINPSRNPYGSPLRTDLPDGLIADIEAIVTVSGRQVFMWGGRWSTPDPMHFQIGASPGEIASGIIIPDTEDAMYPLIRTDGFDDGRTHKREDVRLTQYRLLALDYSLGDDGADGKYGGDTTAAVLAFCNDQKLTELADGTAINGEIIDGLVGVRLEAVYIASKATGGGGLSKDEADATYAQKGHGHGGLAKKDHGHEGTVTLT